MHRLRLLFISALNLSGSCDWPEGVGGALYSKSFLDTSLLIVNTKARAVVVVRGLLPAGRFVSKYLLLTTFTKDGRPKPTAIWGVPEGGKLLVITDDGSWKTKRIKNTPRVTIAKSGSLGKPKSDDVEGVARVLPKSETRRVYNAVLKRYWYHAPWFYAHSIVRGGIDKVHVGLEIEPAG
jgi:PPOX class probable F420-dependent enzyme